ncbi:hypothetical protein M0R45_036901 [Rubus argutus]|uniref:Uncharacterized protein n=1 Tax=Rubus argutus TaxID=59490 RepID=A0AAW1W0Q4_RUBAR
MASFSFNTTRIRTPTLQSHKPISKLISRTKPISTFSTNPSKNRPRLHYFRSNSVSESSVSTQQVDEVGEVEDDPTAELSYLDPETDPESITEWELDFCSRPILDIRGEEGVPLPEKIRYFRSQMQTIITKACNELGIKPIPSKRCLSLLLMINPFPMELPENLFGEKWAFVQLPFSAVQKEISSLDSNLVFGASLDLDLLGIEIDDETLIPGLAVASSRAITPSSRFCTGCLILSVGISGRYIYATYKKSPVTTNEAEAWEAAKKACGGLHFLAIQENLESDDCVGFWLLLDLPPPPV